MSDTEPMVLWFIISDKLPACWTSFSNQEIKYLALFQMRGTDEKIDLEIPGSVMEMTEGSQVHVCSPRVFSSIAYN